MKPRNLIAASAVAIIAAAAVVFATGDDLSERSVVLGDLPDDEQSYVRFILENLKDAPKPFNEECDPKIYMQAARKEIYGDDADLKRFEDQCSRGSAAISIMIERIDAAQFAFHAEQCEANKSLRSDYKSAEIDELKKAKELANARHTYHTDIPVFDEFFELNIDELRSQFEVDRKSKLSALRRLNACEKKVTIERKS